MCIFTFWVFNMGFRHILLFTAGILLSSMAAAQQLLTIHGIISKNMTSERIAQALVHNLRTHSVMMSDELGYFTIEAAVGDTLLFTKRGFNDEKIEIHGGGSMPVSMQPVIQLSTVTVQGQSDRKELSDVMADYRRNGTFYDGSPPILSFLTSPITGFYELFGATPNAAKRFKAFSKNALEADEVHKRYNLAFVKRITNAPDSTAVLFMQYYTPSYPDMKEWNDYDLIRHVKSSYDFYIKNKDKMNLNQLNSPSLQKVDIKKSLVEPIKN